MPHVPTLLYRPSEERMVSASKRLSHANMHRSDLPEYSDQEEYNQDVLRLEAPTAEDTLDQDLLQEAAVLGIQIPGVAPEVREGLASLCDSAATIESRHTRTGSTGSEASASTGATSRSSSVHPPANSTPLPQARKTWQRFLSLSEYERYLSQADTQQSPNTRTGRPLPSESAASIFSVSTYKSYKSLKDGIRSRFGFRRPRVSEDTNFCICCRDEFRRNKSLHALPCSHKYCEKCLRILIQQATADELKMPPKCCSEPVPDSIIKSVLSRDDQRKFTNSALQFSTLWEDRIFGPSLKCGEFISGQHTINPRHPLEVACGKYCLICKRGAQKLGQDCPADWEPDAVLQTGESQGWRRCYKCHTLVELIQECTHITCRCKAQFCYTCGAVWSPSIGCPNSCNREEELERRRHEEEATAAMEAADNAREEAAEAYRAAEQLEAVKRSEQSEVLSGLRLKHADERDRFVSFERKMKWDMWTKQGQLKLDVLDHYGDLQSKMVERHAKTISHLEDRQVAAEMELRASLKQSERSVHIRLRHMEAYCDGLGRSASGSNPARVVTERDLRELEQQYNLRDDLERLHQSRINVIREKQSKQMEQLLTRQEEEVENLAQKQADELDAQEDTFSAEEEKFNRLFRERRQRLKRRWLLVNEITRRKLEKETGLRFAQLPELDWPDLDDCILGI